jgi:hypothetical protein
VNVLIIDIRADSNADRLGSIPGKLTNEFSVHEAEQADACHIGARQRCKSLILVTGSSGTKKASRGGQSLACLGRCQQRAVWRRRIRVDVDGRAQIGSGTHTVTLQGEDGRPQQISIPKR